MVWVPGGKFMMGSDSHHAEELPARAVEVSGFWLGRTTVTNADYARFVQDTGYVTVAERPLDPAGFPGAPAENLVPGSMVFTRTPGPVDLRHLNQWWTWTAGACWRRPEGSRTDLVSREHHPVVHVAHEDAQAYATWAELTLPTEAQWERAGRGVLEGTTDTWGTSPKSAVSDVRTTGAGTSPGGLSPATARPRNGYGLSDMAGNVWEWTDD